MKLNRRQLRKLIMETIKKDWEGMTHDAAAAQGNKDEEEFKVVVDKLIGRYGMSADQLKRLVDEVNARYTSSGPGQPEWYDDDRGHETLADKKFSDSLSDEDDSMFPPWKGSGGWE